MRSAHLALVMACLAAPALALGGCAVDGDAESQGVGTMRMPLRAIAADGTEYQLRQATFEITGPVNETILSEDHLADDVAQVVLATGDYQVELTGMWQMERLVGGAAEPVEATLVSSNPAAFSIADQGLTSVTFRFEVDGEVIDLGEGILELRIEVDETEEPPPGPEPGDLLFSVVGPGQLPISAAGLPGDRVVVGAGPVTRFAVAANGLLWQSVAQRPGTTQTVAAGGPNEVLDATSGGQLFVESFSAIDGGTMNYVVPANANGATTPAAIAAAPGGGAVYAVGTAGNGTVGRLGPGGNQMWIAPGPSAGTARDIEVVQPNTVVALFSQANQGQVSVTSVDLNGGQRMITMFPMPGQAYALRSESGPMVLVYGSQGGQAVVQRVDSLAGVPLGQLVLASFPAPIVDIEPGANGLVAIATQDSLLHVLDAAGMVLYSNAVAGGVVRSVVFLPTSNAVCAVASDGAQSTTSCFAN